MPTKTRRRVLLTVFVVLTAMATLAMIAQYQVILAEAYSRYQELNAQNHYFDSIFITNGEESSTPIYVEEYLYQPIYDVSFAGPYGCAVKIFPTDNS